jgi:hypothetical protein
MKYTIQRLDGRYSHKDLFQYYIGFSTRMSHDQGPLCFNQVQKWFTETYGWSAEVRQYADILNWAQTTNNISMTMHKKFGNHPMFRQNSLSRVDVPDCCNPLWSWTNSFEDLRIYVKSDAELSFFCLAFPVD